MTTLISAFPQGIVEGKYIICGDIFGGSGRSFKYNTENDLWSDFATGQSGKGLESLYRLRGQDMPVIRRQSVGHIPSAPRAEFSRVELKDEFCPTFSIPNPMREFRMPPRAGGKLWKTWEYKNPAGQTAFYTARYNYRDGSKEVCPYSFNGKNWVGRAWPQKRPLYNSDKISRYQKIMIVEGEKCADFVEEAFPDYLGVCWQGGSNAVKKSDWALIKGKKVVIFPDNDRAGYKAANDVRNILSGSNDINVLDIYKMDVEEGFDLEDLIELVGDLKGFRNYYGI